MNPTHCPTCRSPDIQPFYRMDNAPVHSVVLLHNREKALTFPKGEIRLGFCQSCGLISNLAFDVRMQDYSADSESTQSFSQTFDAFSRDLARHLVERYDLHHKTILEIGCGMGEFLTLLCELGGKRGIGFDPAYRPERIQNQDKHDILFVRDYYSEKYSSHRADFVVCKMTLEHIPDAGAFVSMVRRALRDSPEAVVFFQVPEVRRILQEIAFWDVYYEHCSYFSPGSLARLFRRSGFEVLNLYTDFGGQYVMIEARPSNGNGASFPKLEEDLPALQAEVNFFAQKVRSRLGAWKDFFLVGAKEGRKTVLWGAGSKAVAFLTTLGIRDEVEFCVDVNPHKHDTFLPGAGQKVVAPAAMQQVRPDVVIAMNAIYREEIARTLAKLNIDAELIAVNELPGLPIL